MDIGDLNRTVALGNLANAANAQKLAREQARRDYRLQEQNKEILKELKRQADKQKAEEDRLNKMPACPECLSKIPVKSKRCPHCQQPVVSWDYLESPYQWRLIAPLKSAASVIKSRDQYLEAEYKQALASLLEYTNALNVRLSDCKLSAGSFFKYLKKNRPSGRGNPEQLIVSGICGGSLCPDDDPQLASQLANWRRCQIDRDSAWTALLKADEAVARVTASGVGCGYGLALLIIVPLFLGYIALVFNDGSDRLRPEWAYLLLAPIVLPGCGFVIKKLREVWVRLHKKLRSHRCQVAQQRVNDAQAALEQARNLIISKRQDALENAGLSGCYARLRDFLTSYEETSRKIMRLGHAVGSVVAAFEDTKACCRHHGLEMPPDPRKDGKCLAELSCVREKLPKFRSLNEVNVFLDAIAVRLPIR